MRHRRRCAAKYAPGCISPLQSSLASQLPCRTHEGGNPPYYTHQPTIVELLGTCIQRPRGWQSRKCSSGTEKISSTSSDLESGQFPWALVSILPSRRRVLYNIFPVFYENNKLYHVRLETQNSRPSHRQSMGQVPQRYNLMLVEVFPNVKYFHGLPRNEYMASKEDYRRHLNFRWNNMFSALVRELISWG